MDSEVAKHMNTGVMDSVSTQLSEMNTMRAQLNVFIDDSAVKEVIKTISLVPKDDAVDLNDNTITDNMNCAESKEREAVENITSVADTTTVDGKNSSNPPLDTQITAVATPTKEQAFTDGMATGDFNSTPVINSQLMTPTNIDVNQDTEVGIEIEIESDTDFIDLIDDDDNAINSTKIVPPKSKVYPSRRKRELAPKTSKAISPTKRRSKLKKNIEEEPMIRVLQGEVEKLTAAVKNLQETVIEQGRRIEELTNPPQKADRDEMDVKLESLESRIINFYNDQDQKCANRKEELLAIVRREGKDISTKAETALKTAKLAVTENVSAVKCNELSAEITNIGQKVDMWEQKVEDIEHCLNSLKTDDSPFKPVTPCKTKASNNLPQSRSSVDTSKDVQEFGTENEVKKSAVNPHQKSPPPSLKDKETSNDRAGNIDLPQGNTHPHLRKTIMFMDSNQAYLDSRSLWKNLTLVTCKTTHDLRQKLESTKMDDYEIIFIHTGVNNIDSEDGSVVAYDLLDIVKKIRQFHPWLKIVVSEITPRQIYRDDEVQKCNEIMVAQLEKIENVTVAHHYNLRNDQWSFHKKDDDKHFTKISISLFASNIKTALRKCLGIPSNAKRRNSEFHQSRKQNTGNDRSRPSYRNVKNKNTGAAGHSLKDALMQFLKDFKE